MVSKQHNHEAYWADYNGLQSVKHQILANYLDAWFQILPRRFRRVFYIDTHAGRGRHKTGDLGSPLIVLSRLLTANYPEAVVQGSKVILAFYEINQKYCDELNSELSECDIPPHIEVRQPICGDYEKHFDRLIYEIKGDHNIPNPAFAFVDPFNCTLSMELLKRFLSLPSCEIMVNLMYMEIRKEAVLPSMRQRLNKLYGSSVWEECLQFKNSTKKSRCFARVFAKQLGVNFPQRPIEMWAGGQIKYFLIHATNNKLGYEKMKDAIWRVIPDGTYHAVEEDRPEQRVENIKIEPNLGPLRERVKELFDKYKYDAVAIYEVLIHDLSSYKLSHVKKVLKELQEEEKQRKGQQRLF